MLKIIKLKLTQTAGVLLTLIASGIVWISTAQALDMHFAFQATFANPPAGVNEIFPKLWIKTGPASGHGGSIRYQMLTFPESLNPASTTSTATVVLLKNTQTITPMVSLITYDKSGSPLRFHDISCNTSLNVTGKPKVTVVISKLPTDPRQHRMSCRYIYS